MHRPSPRPSPWAAAVVGVALFAPSAAAQSKDAAAKKLESVAMNADYLATHFNDAATKLDLAIKMCAPKACSAPVLAHLWMSLGIVHGVGQSKLDVAKTDFVEALKSDPNVKLDKDLSTPELHAAFDEARAQASGGATSGAGAIVHTAPAEQTSGTPLPLYVELPKSVSPARITIKYKPPGADDFRALDLAPVGTGFGIEIPCDELGALGDFEYYFIALDTGDAAIATGGSRAQPFRVPMRKTISAEAPHLPGQVAPESCSAPAPTPAAAAATPKEKPVLPPCDSDRECEEGMRCNSDHKCEWRPEEEEPAAPPPPAPVQRNWVGLAFVADLALVSGDDVCTKEAQSSRHFACFQSDGTQYHGTPQPGRADFIKGGIVPATMRVVASYDRVVGANFTVGGRAGFAFNGGPKPDGGSAFFPLHLEARGAYWLGADPFARKGFRPFVFAAFGMMQVDAKVGAQVYETDAALCPTAGTTGPCRNDLDAWRRSGNVFGAIGVGSAYAFTPNQAVVLDVRASQLFGAPGTVISPELGFQTGF